jgi:hypothetical protein
MKRELSCLEEDFKIVDKELEMDFNCEIEDLEFDDESWCRRFYKKVVKVYDECSDLEDFKNEVNKIYNKDSIW